MSFRIYVDTRHNEIPMPDDPSKFDAWLEECDKFSLYDEPLGADDTVYRFWSSIANQIALPIIASIYVQGLSIDDSEELNKLEKELDELEHYWKSHHLEDPDPRSGVRDCLEEHLQERMGFFRNAIRVARKHNAVLEVS